MRKALFGLTIALFFAGCSTRSTRNPLLARIDSLQRIDPDAAFNRLYEGKIKLESAEDTVFYNLLCCETYLQKPLSFQTNSLPDQLIAHYKNHGTRALLSRAYLCKSINQYKHGNYKDALANAIAAQETADKQDDYPYCRLQLTLGSINLDNGCYQLALRQFREARKTALRFDRNPTLIARCYLLESKAHKRLNHADSTVKCLKLTLPFINKTDPSTYAEILTSLGEWYFDRGDYTQSGAYLARAYPFDYTYRTAMAIGNLWQHRRNTAMAADYWYKAANSNEHDIRMAALDSLLKIKPGNTFLLQEYHRATKESPSINTDEIARLQSDFEQNALQKRAYQRISVLLLVIILLMVAAFVGRRYYINKVKRLYRNLNNVNARYVHDLEAYRWAKNEISRLEKRIADYQDDRKAPEKWNIENEMLGTDCVITLHRLASRGRQAPENSRQELYQLVANHDPSLMKTLHQSHLNEKERLVCLLIRLRFIPSELSVLLGISPQNVTNMRQRLLQKLFHAQGGAKDFDERIRSL